MNTTRTKISQAPENQARQDFENGILPQTTNFLSLIEQTQKLIAQKQDLLLRKRTLVQLVIELKEEMAIQQKATEAITSQIKNMLDCNDAIRKEILDLRRTQQK